MKEKLAALQELAERLSYEEHIRSDYGEGATYKTPWELFDQHDAQEAVASSAADARAGERDSTGSWGTDREVSEDSPDS